MVNATARWWLLIAAMAVAACGDSGDEADSEGPTADLPTGWEDAKPVEELLQFSCSGSALDGGDERMEARGGEGQILIEYFDAHFRCAQDVEAFARESGAALDVLVQPVDMDPEAVAACDCLYEIHMLVETEERDYTLTLYRRWDNINSDNEPVEIDSASVSARVE